MSTFIVDFLEMSGLFNSSMKAGLHAAGWTQIDLARKLGVTQNTVSRWMKGSHLPDSYRLSEIASLFDWDEGRVSAIIEDWYLNQEGRSNFRIAGHSFVTARFGGDFTRFSEEILKLDRLTMPGLDSRYLGTAEQWAPIFQDTSSWRILCDRKQIVGYWQSVCLKEEAFSSLIRDEVFDADIDCDMVEQAIFPGRYMTYLCGLIVNPTFSHTTAYAKLFASLRQFIRDQAFEGIFFKRIGARAATPIGARICERVGMQCIGGEMYLLDARELARSPLVSCNRTLGLYQDAFSS